MSAIREFFESRFPDEVHATSLSHPAAAAMATLLCSGAYSGARLVACRRASDHADRPEMIVVDVEVALGQRPTINDVRSLEPVGIAYGRQGSLPTVYPLRDSFPSEVPHFNLSGRGQPRSLCLFDMQPEEALRLATPLVLIERVRFWMRETAYGRLHGEEQPLDPVFFGAITQVILPQHLDQGADAYIGVRRADRFDAPIFLLPCTPNFPGGKSTMSTILVKTGPLPHGRLREVPVNVAELLEVYADLGIDLVPTLKSALRAWLTKPDWRTLSDTACLIILQTVLERAPGKFGGEAIKAFFTTFKAVELAEQLGAFQRAGEYAALLLVQQPHDMEKLRGLALLPMDVCRPFDRQMAQAASGLADSSESTKRILLAGAGALGSQVAITAARMGLGSWTIVDDDYLLPHNMARHGLSHLHVGRSKAEALASEIRGLLGDEASSFHFDRVENVTPEALSTSEFVIDATASVPAARWMATVSTHTGRTCSVFLNPAGTDLVLLVEGENRSPRLDFVEMSYYWALASWNARDGHLSSGRLGLFPSGGCRRASLAISQADIGSLAPIAVKRLLQYSLPGHGLVEIISATEVTFSCPAADFSELELGKWTVAISNDVLDGIVTDREAAEGLETGGILVGTWDRVRQRVYVVGRYAPPPDSVAGPLSFVRGAEGVYQTLEAVERLTAGNLTYIGEWHTHPVGHGSQPSSDDRTLLKWIGEVLLFSDVHALMLVAGTDGVRVVMGQSDLTCLVPPRNSRPETPP